MRDATRVHAPTTTYSLHGLCVRSEIPLPELQPVEGTPDVDIRWGERIAVPAEPPEGKALAVRDPDLGGYTITEEETGYTIRFYGEYDFRISRDTRTIRVHVAPEADPEIVPVVLAGNVLATVLELRGECVLHASCVHVDGSTVAVVGDSGMGKSTLAALFCAEGAQLVSDDALRIDCVDGNPLCYRGTGQIRLRPAAAQLAVSFPAGVSEETSDGRIGVNAEQAREPKLRLDAILVPHPSRTIRRLRVERLGQRGALIALVSYPRIAGWQLTDPIRRHFDVLACVAGTVPVFEATVPWGPPFAEGIATALLSELGISASAVGS